MLKCTCATHWRGGGFIPACCSPAHSCPAAINNSIAACCFVLRPCTDRHVICSASPACWRCNPCQCSQYTPISHPCVNPTGASKIAFSPSISYSDARHKLLRCKLAQYVVICKAQWTRYWDEILNPMSVLRVRKLTEARSQVQSVPISK